MAVGVISLATLFNQAIDCFEYVRIARNFERDYETAKLKLNSAQLRLSRWGESVDFKSMSREETSHVENNLRRIVNNFDDAERLSHRFSRSNRGVDEADNTSDRGGEASSIAVLLKKMHTLSLNRLRQETGPTTSPRKRAKWTIYSERQFKGLVTDISALITDLIELFPRARETQEKLCEFEIYEFTDSLRTLAKAIEGQDEHLTLALANMLNPTVSCLYASVHFHAELFLGEAYQHMAQHKQSSGNSGRKAIWCHKPNIRSAGHQGAMRVYYTS